jgi:hypothetical protein
MKNLKQKVETLTLKYIEIFPEEYSLVVKYLNGEREKNTNKFASVSQDKTLQRKIYEIPETLNKMFIKDLTAEELIMMKDGQNGKDFAHWFAKRFPEFAGGTTI